MNIFHLSQCPSRSASYLCDKHVNKMLTETVQMLSAVHFIHGNHHDDMMSPYWRRHPMSKWIAETEGNYRWTYKHFVGIMNEYWKRYYKVHATFRKAQYFVDAPPAIPKAGFTTPPLCMPDQYHSSNYVASYRMYYAREKSHFAKWVKGTDVPFWYPQLAST